MQKKTNSPLRLVLPGVENNIIENITEIAWCQADDHRVYIFLKNGHRCKGGISLTQLKRKLRLKMFFKTNRSFIINMHCVQCYYKNNRALIAQLADGTKIPVAESRKKDFKELAHCFPSITRV